MTVPLKFNPPTQPGERATGSTRTCCDLSLARAREGSFRFLTRPLRWKRDRSLASTPGSAELTLATTNPSDELIYLPAAHQLTSLPPSAGVARPSAGAAQLLGFATKESLAPGLSTT